MAEDVAATAPREAEVMTIAHGTAVLRSPAPPGRPDHVAAWVTAPRLPPLPDAEGCLGGGQFARYPAGQPAARPHPGAAARQGVLPPPPGREAYRIAQEGLANALKHAPGAPVLLRLERTASRLSVRLAQPLSPAPRSPSARGGRWLAGVAERARLLGGSVTAGPSGGDWVLDVTLPTGVAPGPRTGEETP